MARHVHRNGSLVFTGQVRRAKLEGRTHTWNDHGPTHHNDVGYAQRSRAGGDVPSMISPSPRAPGTHVRAAFLENLQTEDFQASG